MTLLPRASGVKRDPVPFSLCITGSKTRGPSTEVNNPTPHSYFSPFLAVWKVAVSWEATGAETLPRIRVFWPLKAERKQTKGIYRNISDEGMEAVTNTNNDDNNNGRRV